MKNRYLEVTYRKGRPLAAYLHLPRPTGEKSARTERAAEGILVDYSEAGDPIGVEITAPGSVDLDEFNKILDRLGCSRLGPKEFAPLGAA